MYLTCVHLYLFRRFQQLSALMSECENWQLYRQELEEQFSTETPLIPFLGQFLTQVGCVCVCVCVACCHNVIDFWSILCNAGQTL